MLRSALAVAALCLSISVSAQPLREHLMKDGRIDDEDVRPKFVTLTPAEVKEQIQVSLAALDEADQLIPAVEVRLPAASNIAYATYEFDEPSVRDSRGATVAIERQSGLLDRYTNSVQLRLFAPGQEKPARFATVKGHVTVRYPLAVATKSIRSGDRRSMSKLGAAVDGPFVRYRRGPIGQAFWSSDIDAVRAWNAAGKRLEREGTYPDEVNGEGFEMVAFHGAPATVEIDIPAESGVVSIDYELTFANPKAASVTKTLLQQERREDSAPASAAGADAGNSSEARAELARLGYPSVDTEQLLAASANGEVKAVKLLLSAGVNPSARGESGRTALHVASATKKREVVDLLLESGADVNARDENGLTPLFGLAARCDQTPTIAKLIARGADVNAKGKSQTSPLALAKAMSCDETVNVLTKAGAR